VLRKLLIEEGFSDEEMLLTGLVRQTGSGRMKDFFSERITFPIKDRTGGVIGFSARKIKEETFGGKYVNTAETPLFKKSQVLFGLCYSRRRIAKERKVLVVEGQVDALRLIDNGFDFTVAGQGTAFGEGHVKELLQLGVSEVYLALDGDGAGQEAAVKIGDLFQTKGVGVTVVKLTDGLDPDAFLRRYGKEAFASLLSSGTDYLSFCYRKLSDGRDLTSPAQKNEIIETIAKKIRAWEQPVMVYESLKKLASMAGIPEEAIKNPPPAVPVFQRKSPTGPQVDADRVLEIDLLRWMILSEDKADIVLKIINKNIRPSDFKLASCAKIFEVYKELAPADRKDMFSFASSLDTEEQRLVFEEVFQRKINPIKAEEGVIETIKKMLLRTWMEKREEIAGRIRTAGQEEEMELSREFNEVAKEMPVVTVD